jgi:hypothetical protein
MHNDAIPEITNHIIAFKDHLLCSAVLYARDLKRNELLPAHLHRPALYARDPEWLPPCAPGCPTRQSPLLLNAFNCHHLRHPALYARDPE